jgi:parallel beta-helix repeat protein
MKRKRSAPIIFAAAAMIAFATSAWAADGTIEINQAKVLAAGGFPYTLSVSGSYRLTGNLAVAAASTNAINVTGSNVTIDLNGFSITGPGVGAGGLGIDGAGAAGTTVENGSVTAFTIGVDVGAYGIVRKVHADGNDYDIGVGNNTVVEGCTANNSMAASGGYGIYCTAGCAISGNTANGDAQLGISCGGDGCAISGNTANGSGENGIQCLGSGCKISGNTAVSNVTFGIYCPGSGCLISGNTILNNGFGISTADSSSGFAGNVLKNKTGDHSGATSLGGNLCSGSVC